MTREEAITYIREWLKDEYALNSKDREALNMAIKVLEQEPCEDCISRKAVFDLLENTNNGWIINKVLQLPSVKPQEPKTVLYSGDGYADGNMVYDMAECPNCGYEYEEDDKDWGLPFCPNCGQSLNWESEGEK